MIHSPALNSDPQLNVPITPDLIQAHGLTLEEYARIQKILGRDPNLTELGIFSVMWSEHCSYKNSKPLLKQFPTTKAYKNPQNTIGQVLVKAGEENAGVIDIGDGWAICFKIESHNHPSAIEPFEGAATGVGGIIRDIFTMGARPILLTNSLRFGELSSPHNRRLFRGVVSGISHYGNCIGIPNVGGDIYFDDCYTGNPLVNALCLGLLKHDQIKRGAASGVGNPVYYVGAATGRDGLGGASFASKELSEESAADRPAVQKGDPFMEKLLMEACLEMMAIPDLVVGIQDMGAAGLTCSTCETASRGHSGIEIELHHVPQREAGMNAYEIMLSESQERMLVIVKKGREKDIETLFEKWDLHAVQIGSVTEGHNMVIQENGSPIAIIPASSLTEEAPIYERESQKPEYLDITSTWSHHTLPLPDFTLLQWALPQLMSHPTIAQKKWVWQQYDSMVMANTVVEPGSDAAVVRLRLDDGKEKFIAIANDCNNRYTYLNPYRGSQIAIAECTRNLVCSGAYPLAMTNNLNFGNPHKPEAFYALRESTRGLADACKFFDIPVVGGNVSLYNENQNGAIDPTPVVSIVGLIQDPKDITRQTLQTGTEDLLLIGGLPHELGGSYYLKQIHNLKTGDAPHLDLEMEQKIQSFILSQIRASRVIAAHDLSEGGLLVALCEMLLSEKTFGAHLSISVPEDLRLDSLLFGESQSRILIATDTTFTPAILQDAQSIGLPILHVGQATQDAHLKVSLILQKQETSFDSVESQDLSWETPLLRKAWEESIPRIMEL